jgi:serine/threonine protein kinase
VAWAGMSDLEANREIAGRYKVVRLIGKGGMGAVYEVEHLHTGQHLAMKVLTAHHHAAAVERFKREARAASRIQSDHIVRVTDADVAPELDGSPFLVMEMLDGTDLEHAAGAGSPPETVVDWLRQVARGLQKAHDGGIIHRDLKPENLFLTKREDGTPLVKILDFGIAKLTGLSSEGGTLTQSDQFLGTPAYMAPEQASNDGAPVTAAADLYSLGLIAFRLLVGRMYWRPGSLAQLLAQLLTEKMVPASERGSKLGPGFDAWLLRSCDRGPGKRFSSVTEQVEALAGALGLPQHAVGATPPGTPKAALSELESAPTLNVPQVTPVAATPSTLETGPTLGASSRELTTVRTRRRWRNVGVGGVAAAVAVAGIVVLARGPSTERPLANPSAAPSVVPAAVAPVDPPAVSAIASPAPAVDAAMASASAAASVAPAPPPAASSRKRPGLLGRADASPGKDPLDGQY